VQILIAEAVLVAVLDEALAGVNHENTFAGGGVFLVEHNDAGGNAGAVEQVGRQADDAFDLTAADDFAADVGFRVAAKQDTVRENDRPFAGALERSQQVEEEGVVAVLGGRDAEGETAVQVIGRVETVAPRLGGERRIGDDEIETLEAATRPTFPKCLRRSFESQLPSPWLDPSAGLQSSRFCAAAPRRLVS